MENLEKTLRKVKLKVEKTKPLPAEKPLYRGLKKIEDKAYEGPTSLKYWM